MDAAETGGRRARTWTAPVLVLLAAVLPYVVRLPFEGKGFAYDDFRFIVRNPHVTPARSVGHFLSRIPSYLTDPHTFDPDSPTGIVRPLRTLEYAFDRTLFGLDAAAFAVHNAVWHGLTSVLLFLLLRKLVRDGRAALFGALIFALHPVQTEAVAWVSSRGDVAMGSCVFGALLCALRSRGLDRWCALGVALGFVGGLYKEVAVTLPALVAAVVWATDPDAGGRVRRGLLRAAPYLASSVAYLAYRQAVMIGGMAHVDTHVMGGGTAGTFATMFRGFGYYLGVLALPVETSLDWYLPSSTTLADPAALAWLAVHVTILGTALLRLRRDPLLSAGIVFVYAPLAPVANWPFSTGIPTTDRFLYVSVSGLALLVATAFSRLPPARRSAATASLATVLASFTLITVVRVGVWRDETTLFEHTVARHATPRGATWVSAERRRAGLALLQDAEKASRPEERAALEAAGHAKLEEALHWAHEAIDAWYRIELVERSKTYVLLEPENNAANLCYLLGDDDHGVFHAREAVRVGLEGLSARGEDAAVPPQASFNLALLLMRTARPVAAMASLEDAIRRGMGLAPDTAADLFLGLEPDLRAAGALELGRAAAAHALELRETPDARARVAWYDAEANSALRPAAGPERAAQAAVTLAALGRLEEADRLVATLPAGAVPRTRWTYARLECRGTPASWAAASDAYEYADDDKAYARYRQGVCQENLAHADRALTAYARALELAAGSAPRPDWMDDAERSRRRLATGCPVRVSHALR